MKTHRERSQFKFKTPRLADVGNQFISSYKPKKKLSDIFQQKAFRFHATDVRAHEFVKKVAMGPLAVVSGRLRNFRRRHVGRRPYV